MLGSPRACGEKQSLFPVPVRAAGSPPRMRGKGRPLDTAEDISRITPAHAGKSQLVNAWESLHWDHPRACGEKPPGSRVYIALLGSPPRMRRKVLSTTAFHEFDGITPAHAGKSSRSSLSGTFCWDHPRACGEKPDSLRCRTYPLGSPPRMRGKVSNNSRAICVSGITPAHAGKRVSLFLLAMLY